MEKTFCSVTTIEMEIHIGMHAGVFLDMLYFWRVLLRQFCDVIWNMCRFGAFEQL